MSTTAGSLAGTVRLSRLFTTLITRKEPRPYHLSGLQPLLWFRYREPCDSESRAGHEERSIGASCDSVWRAGCPRHRASWNNCRSSGDSPMRLSKRIGGFTLIELIATVTILGILVALALPLARNSIKRERERD